MKRKLTYLLSLSLLCCTLGLAFIANYFVDFALKRGNEHNPLAIPPACLQILDPSVTQNALPSYPYASWHNISADGLKLSATYFHPTKTTNKWVVIVHGYGRDQNSIWDIAQVYLAAGYKVLTPDLRAAGNSQGRYLTVGYSEAADLKAWITQIVSREPNADITLHGVSMGAATVILSTAHDLPANVKSIVEDCGYSSAYEMFSLQLKGLYGLPAFPIMPAVNMACKLKANFYLTDSTPLRVIANNKIPMLFIHGTTDTLAPIAMGKALYNAATCNKAFLWVEGAGHADARKYSREQYYAAVFNFIEQYH